MIEDMTSDLPTSLRHFLLESDTDYYQSIASIPLLQPQKTSVLTELQKKFLAATFYHVRGHFINFVWYIANFSTDEAIKSVLMRNIHEEIGVGNRFSHEMLYARFAAFCGVDIHDEIINETHYMPFAKAFNKEHLQWLAEHDNHDRLAAFSAYERLDNLDYPKLVDMARSMNTPSHAMTFFHVHTHVDHFDTTSTLLIPIWERAPDKIKQAFHFIYTAQAAMWQNLSDSVFSI